MRSVFHHGSAVQNVDIVRSGNICQTVGDENNGFCFGKGVNLGHDLVFTLHIDIGGGFIKDIYGAVVQQGPGQGKPLALAAGEIAALFLENRVQPLLAAQEGGQIDLLQNLPEGSIICIWPGHAQIVPHGALEQIGYIGKVLHQAAFRECLHGHAPHRQFPGKAPASAHQQGGQGGFSAAGFAYNGGEAAFREGHGHAVENFPVRLIAEVQLFAFDGARFGHGGALLGRFRQIPKPEDFV